METLVGAGGTLVAIGLVVLALLTILLPVSAFSAQRSARLCYEELRKMNAKLDRLSDG